MRDDLTSDLMGLNEAAVYLGVSRRTIERATRAGRIPSFLNPLSQRRQVHRADLDRILLGITFSEPDGRSGENV